MLQQQMMVSLGVRECCCRILSQAHSARQCSNAGGLLVKCRGHYFQRGAATQDLGYAAILQAASVTRIMRRKHLGKSLRARPDEGWRMHAHGHGWCVLDHCSVCCHTRLRRNCTKGNRPAQSSEKARVPVAHLKKSWPSMLECQHGSHAHN